MRGNFAIGVSRVSKVQPNRLNDNEGAGWNRALVSVRDVLLGGKQRWSLTGRAAGHGSQMLIINADDFGGSENLNRAILEGFRLGLCSSATIMPNMPGFEEACQMTHEHKLLGHIGMHLVLRDGYPLTERIKTRAKFCDSDGRLRLSANKPFLVLDHSEKEDLAAEIRAQIKRCRAFGCPSRIWTRITISIPSGAYWTSCCPWSARSAFPTRE